MTCCGRLRDTAPCSRCIIRLPSLWYASGQEALGGRGSTDRCNRCPIGFVMIVLHVFGRYTVVQTSKGRYSGGGWRVARQDIQSGCKLMMLCRRAPESPKHGLKASRRLLSTAASRVHMSLFVSNLFLLEKTDIFSTGRWSEQRNVRPEATVTIVAKFLTLMPRV